MAQDFDQFPLNDPLIKAKMMMSDEWAAFMGAFFQNIIGYLSQYGIFVPNLTTEQRDSIQSPEKGQMIYNTTVDAPQTFQAGVWKTFTTS
jgi:hypothetical protein